MPREGPVRSAALLAAALGLLAAGCASGPGFRWDVYEESVYRACATRDDDPAEQARLLAAELERAAGEGFAAPPGVRAHLGWLHLRTGNEAEARRWFLEEKAAYPESAVFMERRIERLPR